MHDQGVSQIVYWRKLRMVLPRRQRVVEVEVWVLKAVTQTVSVIKLMASAW